MKFLMTALLALISTSAFADSSNTSLACGDEGGSGRYAMIEIQTVSVSGMSSKLQISYSVEMGSTTPAGKTITKVNYAGSASNKSFATQEQAYQYVANNPLVLTLSGDKGISGVITVVKDKRTATVVDLAAKTSVDFKCFIN